MRVLITGINGFIGSHVAKRLLDENIDIIGLDNDYTSTEKARKSVPISE